MHDTASIAGEAFADVYGGPGKIVIDLGGKNVNGSLRSFFANRGMTFISVDLEDDASVDIVVKPCEKLPFEDGSIDLIVSTSCFEHDPCFWMTFKEMTRLVKPGGFIYVNAPTIGPYHCYPGDNWRFYSDAGQALAYWSGIQVSTEIVYPVKVVETFHMVDNYWNDFVCVWQRVDGPETNITVSSEIVNEIGLLEQRIHDQGFETRKKCSF
jgi:SAM-dependent methyltransferase